MIREKKSLLSKAGGERILMLREKTKAGGEIILMIRIRENRSKITPADHGDDHNRHLVNVFSPESSGIEREKKSDAKSKLEEGPSLVWGFKRAPWKETVDDEEETGNTVEANIGEPSAHPSLAGGKL